MNKFFLDDDLVEGDSVSQPLLSRGLAFGYGVFETMKFIEGRPCFFREHLERLRIGLRGAGLTVELDETVLRNRAFALFEAEEVRSGVFKIVISDVGGIPKIAMFVRTRGFVEEPEVARLKMSNVIKASHAFTSRNKSLNYMESVLELENAKKSGFTECVFRNEFGKLTECAVANLFFVKDGILNTPDVECGLLDGIVRRKVIQIARDGGTPVCVGRFTESDLFVASEVFLTSSGSGPRSAQSFVSTEEGATEYGVDLLPELRAAYLELEKKEALGYDV